MQVLFSGPSCAMLVLISSGDGQYMHCEGQSLRHVQSERVDVCMKKCVEY